METRQLLSWSLYQLLRPLARMALRHGLSVRDLTDISKQAFVDVAREDYGIRGRPTNLTRVATLTGLTRTEVSRLAASDRPKLEDVGSRHPLQRVVSLWLQSAPWCDSEGAPTVLPLTEGDNSFAALVRKTGNGLPYQTLLRELQRMALVAVDGDCVRLLRHGFVPGGEEEADRLPFVGENATALLDTMDHNLRGGKPPRFERRVLFPGLTPAGFAALTELAEAQGQALLEQADNALSPEALPQITPRRMTGLGIYVFDYTQADGGCST